MKVGIYNYHDVYNQNNSIFDSNMYKIGENLEYPFLKLREDLEKKGHSLDTLDIYPLKEYKKIIFLDLPNARKINLEEFYKMNIDLYLVILESQLIRPENMDIENHKYFKKIFTWNDDLVKLDSKKYIKLNIAHKIPIVDKLDRTKKNKFCTIIAGNKKCNDYRELYSERVRAIKWFEENNPEKLDLYGFGWDKYTFYGNKYINYLNRFEFLRKIFAPKYKTYCGIIESKRKVLEKYKFSICYENAKELKGYITEKIFDCFFAGCVPIYWGASNIDKFIPRNCFVDRTKFKNYNELYEFLNSMSEDEYENYIENIENFLKSKEIEKFSGEYFSYLIEKEIF